MATGAASVRRYYAFISYSHRDRAAGDKLFKYLDGYRPPKLLRGRDTPLGPVPGKLYPIFRDREELAASAHLPERLMDALAASEHLVVICSPHAAASAWVNEEVAAFHRLGKEERIHPVLVDGEPAQAFPPALTAGGEPLAADLRPSGDGWKDGALKVVAGLLGLSFGELKDREAARARFRARVYGAIALAFAALFVIAGISAWRSVEQTRAAEAQLGRAEAAILVAVEGIERIVMQVGLGHQSGRLSTGVAQSLLATADALLRGISAVAPDNPQLRFQEAKLLRLLSEHHLRSGNLVLAKDAASRSLDRLERLEPVEGVAARNVDRAIWRASVLMQRGNVLVMAGEFEAALADFSNGLDLLRAPGIQADPAVKRMIALGMDKVAVVTKAITGNSADIIAIHQESVAIRRELLAAQPDDAPLLRELALSLELIGELQQQAGQRALALAAYSESADLLRRITTSDPASMDWGYTLAAALNTVGDLWRSAGEFERALAAYQEALQLGRRITNADPSVSVWQQLVTETLRSICDLHRQSGAYSEAATACRESVDILRRLTESEPRNLIQLDTLGASLIALGDATAAAGDRVSALAAFNESLAIGRRLAASQRHGPDLVAIALERIGDIQWDEGNHDSARTAYDEMLTIRRTVAAADPGNAQRARALSVGLNRIGKVRAAEGDRAGALRAYAEGLAIRRRLAASDPGNATWASDVAFSLIKVADVTDDENLAHAHHREALAIVEGLQKEGRLLPVDAWMIDDLKSRPSAASASR